jgi:hypothetical protein
MPSLLQTLAVAVAAASILAVGSAADISASSSLGRQLLAAARSTDNDHRHLADDNNNNYSFLNSYSIKFQGCHHVQQWNENVDEDNDVRIMTKRLVRFRLCPTEFCNNEKSAGCNSKFGDYIVDMDTFVASYLSAMEADREQLCEQVKGDCKDYCGGDGDEQYDCLYSCYDGYEATSCMNADDNENDNFDTSEYAACKQYDLNGNGARRRLDDAAAEVNYYIGAYCADQGGEIRLGVFTDDTCTSFVSGGPALFASATGYTLPYSQDSLVSTRCLSCVSSANDNDNNGNSAQTKEVCSTIYAVSGKCETKMSIDYPNESSCNYIEGVKIIRQDGVIRTSTTRKSKAAAVSIGLFTTMSVLLASYVFYLRTKLARAQINLSAAAQPLNL